MAKFDSKNKVSVWLNKSKSGVEYYSGTVNVEGVDYKITLFKNDYKENEKQPDFKGSIEKK